MSRAYDIEVEDGEWVHLSLYEDDEKMVGSMFPVAAWADAEAEAKAEGEEWVRKGSA